VIESMAMVDSNGRSRRSANRTRIGNWTMVGAELSLTSGIVYGNIAPGLVLGAMLGAILGGRDDTSAAWRDSSDKP